MLEDEEKALVSEEEHQKYETCIKMWTETIKSTTKAEGEKKKEFRRAYQIIKYWRSRASKLSNLQQELNHKEVAVLKDRYRK